MRGKTLTVGGVDLCETFGLLLTGYTLSPPAPKTYTVDIPGGDGAVDVTEAVAGDVAYGNRDMSFEFFADVGDFELAKTELCRFLHGRRFDFQLSWDPGYTYRGRFSVDEYAPVARRGTVRLAVDADPYKSAGSRTVRVDAAGGASVNLPCGRRRQCPTFECASEFLVNWGGETVRVQPGAHRVRGLWLSQGDNEVWLDSAPGMGDALISDYASDTVASHADERIGDLFWRHRPASPDSRAVYVTYEIEEL